MKDYGLTRSAEEPLELDVKETKVFVAENIHQVTVPTEDGEVTEYEFNYLEYSKDEYILMMAEKNTALEEQMTQTQIGLCEVYELIG